MSTVHSGGVVKANSNTTPSQTVIDTAPIFDEHELTVICRSSEDRPTSIHGQQCIRQPRWMISYSKKETVV
jgi:hypothetical protein